MILLYIYHILTQILEIIISYFIFFHCLWHHEQMAVDDVEGTAIKKFKICG